MKVSWNGAPRRVTVPFIIYSSTRTVLACRVAFFGIRALKGGKFHPKLNMTTRLIANKYREGKAKRTLKRELKVLEIVKGEANIAVEFASVGIPTDLSESIPLRRQVAPTETCGQSSLVVAEFRLSPH